MRHEGNVLLRSRFTFGSSNQLAALCQSATLNSLETDVRDASCGWSCLPQVRPGKPHFEQTATSAEKGPKTDFTVALVVHFYPVSELNGNEKSPSSTSFACFNFQIFFF